MMLSIGKRVTWEQIVELARSIDQADGAREDGERPVHDPAQLLHLAKLVTAFDATVVRWAESRAEGPRLARVTKRTPSGIFRTLEGQGHPTSDELPGQALKAG